MAIIILMLIVFLAWYVKFGAEFFEIRRNKKKHPEDTGSLHNQNTPAKRAYPSNHAAPTKASKSTVTPQRSQFAPSASSRSTAINNDDLNIVTNSLYLTHLTNSSLEQKSSRTCDFPTTKSNSSSSNSSGWGSTSDSSYSSSSSSSSDSGSSGSSDSSSSFCD